MSAITVGGDLVHYEVLGRGRPVVLVHGWVGSWRYWIPLMQQLHLKYRVYAVDLFGFGDSSKNREKYTIEHQVKLLEEFMKELGVPKAAMIGHGLGAQVIMEFAQHHQDMVVRMLIANAPLFDPGDLNTRVPPGHRVLLTGTNEAEKQAMMDIKALATAATNSTATPTPTPSTPTPVDTPKTEPDPTVYRRPDLVIGAGADATLPSTKSGGIDRAKLEAAALARAEADMTARKNAEPPTDPLPGLNKMQPGNATNNPLYRKVGNSNSEALLSRCFKRSEAAYEKLNQDIAKQDDTALTRLTNGFDPGRMLDILRMLSMPIVIVHGMDDPLIDAPNENVWNYLTLEKEESVLPVPLPGVRHFPMLEADAFIRLVNNFLELQDLSKLELKERWRRRSR
ncbi:MAG: alpha/beta hydrolase [Anaerolineae bacterium]|nr:alpha/beta hydrolase [Anaerolineae bacterium]